MFVYADARIRHLWTERGDSNRNDSRGVSAGLRGCQDFCLRFPGLQHQNQKLLYINIWQVRLKSVFCN